jgi:hypothetical protein
LPLLEVVQHTKFWLIGPRVLCPDLDDAVAFRQRNPRRHDLAGQVVPARADADRNRDRQPACQGEARILEQHSDAELHVERQAAQPRQSAAFA